MWLTGAVETPVLAEARAAIESFFPPSHGLAALYSTGMEAAEFALRLARVATGRRAVVGFARSTHGKSLATASLGWDNTNAPPVPGFHRLPFLPEAPEEDILASLERTLADEPVSAVVVEPVHGAGGGHAASAAFHHSVSALCRRHGALLVFDEILTGFYRTGPRFVFEALGVVPDVVLIGKALGNGFPVAGVVAARSLAIVPEMLPGSTYAGNPLAAAAVAATLAEMRRLDLPALVGRIEATMRRHLGDLSARGVALRGAGALSVLELPGLDAAQTATIAAWKRGVAVGLAGRCIRLLPGATITAAHLEQACTVVRDEVEKACAGSHG